MYKKYTQYLLTVFCPIITIILVTYSTVFLQNVFFKIIVIIGVFLTKLFRCVQDAICLSRTFESWFGGRR